MIYLPLLWVLVSIPLSFIGSIVAFKKKAIKHPTPINAIQLIVTYEFNINKQILTGILASLIPYVSFAT